MGPAPSHQKQELEIENWIQAIENQQNSLFPRVNSYRKRLLINRYTNDLIEEYQMQFLNQQDFASYSKEIQARKQRDQNQKIELLSYGDEKFKYCPYIYPVRYFTNTSTEELCSTLYTGLLYISKVQLRLKQVNDIPFKDLIYLYHVCFQGFKMLYERIGVFSINEEMIFFNKEGKAKVWMNPDLSKHQPYSAVQNSRNLNSEVNGSQSQMIKTIINIVESNSDGVLISHIPTFLNYLQAKNLYDRMTFYKIVEQFEQYCSIYNLNHENRANSIYQLFHPQQAELYASKITNDHNHLKGLNSHLEPEVSFQKINKFQSSKISRQSHNDNLIGTKINSIIKQQSHHHLNNRMFQTFNQRRTVQYQSQVPKSLQKYQFNQSQIIADHNQSLNNINSFKNNLATHPLLNNSNAKKNQQNESKLERFRSPQRTLYTQQSKPIIFNYQPVVNIQTNSKNHMVSKPQQIKYNHQKPLYQTQQTGNKERSQSIIDKLNGPLHFRTVNTINSMGSINRDDQLFSEIFKAPQKQISYFSSKQWFVLDDEIARDMEKYLGYNPNRQ